MRMTIEEIKNHPWYLKEEVATEDEIIMEFSIRQASIHHNKEKHE